MFTAMTFLPSFFGMHLGFQEAFHSLLNFIQAHKEASVLSTNLWCSIAPSYTVSSLARVDLLEQ